MNTLKATRGLIGPLLSGNVEISGLVGREWRPSVGIAPIGSPDTFPSLVYEGTCKHVDEAVELALKALPAWKKTGRLRRASLLEKLATALSDNLDAFATCETFYGKPISQSREDILECISTLRYYARSHEEFAPESESRGDNVRVKREAIGVVGLISAFNYPLLLATWKLAPALLAGNTIVIKPEPQTPQSTVFLGHLMTQVGFPSGVISVIPGGADVGKRISSHPKISKVSFTGSISTARQLLNDSATSNLKPLTLELGGKSPLVICESADLEVTIPKIVNAAFSNMGQNCCCGSLLFIHETVYESVIERLKQATEKLKIGNPFDESVDIGPLIDKSATSKVLKYIELGKSTAGIDLLTGGNFIGEDGSNLVQPTIFTNVPKVHQLATEEIFGPVLAIRSPFTSLTTVITEINASPYGLAAGIFSTSSSELDLLSDEIEAGIVWRNVYNIIPVNSPFGGWKQSGWGKELGKEGLDEWLRVKTVIGN